MILIDANTVIHYLKGWEPVVRRWHATTPQELAIPSIVAYEIEYRTLKIATPRRRAVVSELLSAVEHVAFDRDAAHAAAQIRFKLEACGHVIAPLDLMIAGTALSRRAALVTSNTKELSRIKGLALLDWTEEFA